MNKIALFVLLGLFFSAQADVEGLIPKNPKEASYDFKQLVTARNYPVQEHKITTSDGYILTFFRIQAKNTQLKSGLPPVLINHGLLDSSDSFVLNVEAEAPGLILANQGYDVWFTNNRGNKYSLGHTNPKYKSDDNNNIFWEFSWQEMSQYDLPAALEYIAHQTGQKVHYMGHSEGTTLMFAALARRDPVVTKYLNKFIALAPAVFLQHSTSSLVQIGGWIKAGNLLKKYEFLMQNKKFGWMSPAVRKAYVSVCVVSLPVCITRAKLLSGVNKEYDNVSLLPVNSGHYPAGSSLQNMNYWSQMFNEAHFKMYDFGAKKNQAVYGSSTPPIYDLGKITEAVYMFIGTEDTLASVADTANLRGKLTGSSRVEYRTYHLGHSSFLYAIDVQQYMNDVLDVLRK